MIPTRRRFRLYVDESGDHTYKLLDDPSRRYLGLTGVAIETEYYRSQFQPAFETLKQKHFPHSPDDPVVLVRRLIIDRKEAFGVLANPTVRAAWDRDLLDFLASARFEVFTIVIDKKTHLASYGDNARHPYHYCLTLLLERLRGWLSARGGVADVLAEARGGAEDKLLAAEYNSIWRLGTDFQSAADMQAVLTTREIKLQWKYRNIAGLQVADLLAAPSKQDILVRNGRLPAPVPGSYSDEIIKMVGRKYNRYARILLSGFH